MKKQLPSLILSCALIVCLAVCMVQISGLRSEVQTLKSQLSMDISSLHGTISSISSRTAAAVSDALNAESDPLHSIDWQWLALDTAERTVTARITALPKSYDAQSTVASLTLGGQTVPMTLVGSEYVAEISLPLLEDTELTSVQLTDGSTVHTSLVNATLRPRSSLLPRISATFPGRGTGRVQDSTYVWTFTGSMELEPSTPQEHITFTDIALVTRIGGQETSRQPLTDLNVSLEQTATARADGYNTNISYNSELDITASAPFGSTMEVYVEAADSLGLIHRVWLWGYAISETGNVTSLQDLPEYFGAIYTPDGTLLYQPDALIYQSY